MMAVLFIISSILNGAKKKQQQNPKGMPPFNNAPTRPNVEKPNPNVHEKRKSLEDFANQVFQQLNDKSQQNQPMETTVMQEEPMKVNDSSREGNTIQTTSQKGRPSLDGNRSSNRGSLNSLKSPSADAIKENEIGSFVPTTRKELVHAIITTEILGPPKAKQR